MTRPELKVKMEIGSNTDWNRWGLDDPFWGVASWAGKQKGSDKAWTREELYALGESDFKDYLHHWQQYGVNLKNCLEIGCGVGRITSQLGKVFEKVFAVDVSAEMICQAQKTVGLNVELSLIDGLNLPYKDCSVASLFSTYVLQHLDDVETGFSYFREFGRVLEPGGTFMVQLPLFSFPRLARPLDRIMRELHGMSRRLGTLKANLQRKRGRSLMRVTPYASEELHRVLMHAGFVEIEFRMFSIKSNGELFWCVFGKKPPLSAVDCL